MAYIEELSDEMDVSLGEILGALAAFGLCAIAVCFGGRM